MIDWDRMVNGPVQAQFGEPAQFLPVAGAAFGINGTFHEAYKAVDLVGGTGIATEMPALGVRLAEFAVPPACRLVAVITTRSRWRGGTANSANRTPRAGISVAMPVPPTRSTAL